MNRTLTSTAVLSAVALAAPTLAQSSNVSPDHMYSWGENVGFMNWYSAGSPQGSQGVVIQSTYLAGYIWCENVGWINVGDGTPANGFTYANATGADFGVNVDAAGNLTGLAWGENIGWVNFAGGAMASPAQPARIDRNQAR